MDEIGSELWIVECNDKTMSKGWFFMWAYPNEKMADKQATVQFRADKYQTRVRRFVAAPEQKP